MSQKVRASLFELLYDRLSESLSVHGQLPCALWHEQAHEEGELFFRAPHSIGHENVGKIYVKLNVFYDLGIINS